MKLLLKSNKETLVVIILLAISGLAHAVNMFHFPAYFDDEGTYMSQAWAVAKQGKLAPYTYWYDHAPLGWIIISAFTQLIGGFFTFGFSINSGRVLMFLVQVVNTYLLFRIAKNLTKSTFIGSIVTLSFSLSPLAISVHRMVFLDNLATLFLLLSLFLLLNNTRLVRIYLGAISFAVASLVKESIPIFLPVFVILLLVKSEKTHRMFAVFGFLVLVLLIISVYPLFAFLKNELFPGGGHVSLIGSILWQMGRDGGFFLDPKSEFMHTFMNSWFYTDPILVVVGPIASFVNLFIGIRKRNYLIVSSLAAIYILFIIRGGIVNDQYIIPLLPFLALNIGFLLHAIYFKAIPAIVFCLASAFVYVGNPGVYVLDQTSNQVQAVEWIKENIKKDKIVVADAYALTDLFDQDGQDIRKETGVQHYWKVDTDPEIRYDLLDNNWSNMEYILVTPKLRHDIALRGFPLLKPLYENSEVIATFENTRHRLDSGRFRGNILIANGGKVEIRKRNSMDDIALKESWNFYKENFIHSYGQVRDPSNGNTTSEGQSYAMLRAIYFDDKETFDGAWAWAKDHLQYRAGDKLFSWLWNDDEAGVVDAGSAADADGDIAISLIFAYKKWEDPKYLFEALAIVNDIWEKEVKTVDGRLVLVASAEAERDGGYLVNPSYFSPAWYRIFSQVDSTNDWDKLADDSYFWLERVSNNESHLPPNWVWIDKETGEVGSATSYTGNLDSDDYGFDSFRTYYRVALDALWFQNREAINYLALSEPFFEKEIENKGEIKAVYTSDGKEKVTYSSLSTSTAPLVVFSIRDRHLASEFYKNTFENQFHFQERHWGEKDNYYDQNWVSLALALYKGKAVNFWN